VPPVLAAPVASSAATASSAAAATSSAAALSAADAFSLCGAACCSAAASSIEYACGDCVCTTGVEAAGGALAQGPPAEADDSIESLFAARPDVDDPLAPEAGASEDPGPSAVEAYRARCDRIYAHGAGGFCVGRRGHAVQHVGWLPRDAVTVAAIVSSLCLRVRRAQERRAVCAMCVGVLVSDVYLRSPLVICSRAWRLRPAPGADGVTRKIACAGEAALGFLFYHK